MANTTTTDPTQFLTNLFQTGQDMMKPLAGMADPAEVQAAMTDPVAALNSATQMMRQRFLNVISHGSRHIGPAFTEMVAKVYLLIDQMTVAVLKVQCTQMKMTKLAY